MSDTTICPTCKAEYQQQPNVCHYCGYPFAGTEQEKSHFVAHQILKKGTISDTKDSIRNARTILFVIAGFNIVFPFFRFANTQFGGIMIAFSMLIGLVFLFFGFMAKRKPFISILIPFILLVVFYLLDLWLSPATFGRGIFWKVLFVGGLIYSLICIKKSDRIKTESSFLASKDYK